MPLDFIFFKSKFNLLLKDIFRLFSLSNSTSFGWILLNQVCESKNQLKQLHLQIFGSTFKQFFAKGNGEPMYYPTLTNHTIKKKHSKPTSECVDLFLSIV